MAEAMIVGVTGAAGFLGWHLRCRLLAEGIETISATRTTFSDSDALDEFVQASDIIVHVAGVSRAESDQEILDGNVDAAQQLIDALIRSNSSPAVVFTNSTQTERDTPYGSAKRQVGEMLATWAESARSPYCNLMIPHVYGEFGRPNYNSVIATFAHLLVSGDEAQVDPDGELELVHAQDVSQRIVDFIRAPASSTERLQGERISVPQAHDVMHSQYNRYVNENTVPEFNSLLELRLFNVLRGVLHGSDLYPRALTEHTDQRGSFAELVRADGLGQMSISSSHAGIVRGEHFHFDKIERFIVISGQAEICTRRVLTNETHTYQVSSDELTYIDMPTLTTHNIRNTGDSELVTLFWAGDHFDPAMPDTFPLDVVNP